MADKMKKILIVGEESYLATGLTFDSNKYIVDKIRRPYMQSERNKEYDLIINFCIQPEHFTRKLSESEMIDVQIAKSIVKSETKFVFLSSRKVYGSCNELKEYKETDDLKPYDFYSENKAAIEKKLTELIPDNLIILRTGNIIGEPVSRKNYKTFVGWLEKELEENGKVSCTFLPDTKKDFITRDYFQEIVVSVIKNNEAGIYNVGSGFALPIKDILTTLLPKNLIDFDRAVNKSEQFILDNSKIKSFTREFTKKDLLDKCNIICKKYLSKKGI